MSDEDGGLEIDPLFVGLTRPTLLFGVSQIFAVLNALICIGGYVMTNDLRWIPALIVFHVLGFLACSKEPLWLELFMIKMQKCNKCRNKFFHGANSYDMF